MIYLDTSWLVKLYVDEEDASAVRDALADEGLLVSDLAYVEFHSAVARRRRERALTDRQARAILERFVEDWPTYPRVGLSEDVVLLAGDLVGKHPLRALDALQLASALVFAHGAPEKPRFGAADERLRAAAMAEGLEIVAAA